MAAHTQCDGGQSPRALIYENLPEPEPFWEPEEPDCWQRDDDDFADPDHNPIRMQRIESQYWAAREADKLVAPIGDLEPEEPDCWQRDDDDFADPDHNPIRMQRIESQYWAAREADKLVAPIGD